VTRRRSLAVTLTVISFFSGAGLAGLAINSGASGLFFKTALVFGVTTLSTVSVWLAQKLWSRRKLDLPPIPSLKRLSRPKLVRPPLARVDALMRWIYSAKTHERVFAPLRADIIHEWIQATEAGEHRRAWFIAHVRGPLHVVWHMASKIPSDMLSKIAGRLGS
jgi:hypothetical protein